MRILIASFMLLMTVHHSIAQSRINIIPKPSMVQEYKDNLLSTTTRFM